MTKTLHQFVATGFGGAATSKDGSEFTLEFESDTDRLWVTVPSDLLERLIKTATELHALSIDARNGVAARWHVPGQPVDEPE